MPKKANIEKRKQFVISARKVLGDVVTVTRADIQKVCEEENLTFPQWLTVNKDFRAARGEYFLPTADLKTTKNDETDATDDTLTKVAMASNIDHSVLVPDRVQGYVPFGNYNDVRAVIKSQRFYPLYITGLSGNGKTMMVEQVCAIEKRECIRVNVTRQTEEDDLLGGMRLINGQTVWQNGPVIHAMERGAVLLLDEVDLGDEKLMCLQPVLEGRAIFLKKINKVIHPAPGFNIVATANTKGKGSDDGRFIGTNVLNEAFLERFSVTLEQEYPSTRVESRILKGVLRENEISDDDFVTKLVNWAEVIRRAYAEGAISEIISTRRLVHICQAFAIFDKNREKSIELCLNRFDIDTKNSFLDFYKKLDDTIDPLPEEEKSFADIDQEVQF